MDCSPSLFLMFSPEQVKAVTEFKPTRPPVRPVPKSSFLGKSIEETADAFQTITANLEAIDSRWFVILDQGSCAEDTGLIVQVKDGVVDSVRVHFDTINAELIRIEIITYDIQETKAAVRRDGVFRTTLPENRIHGKPAPRKQLK